MKPIRVFFLFVFLVSLVNAETTAAPPTRPRIDDLQKESSSFVGDPDPLDPLPLKKESLKEDDEPVLEDIRSVLNAPSKKKKSKAKKEEGASSDSASKTETPPPPEIIPETPASGQAEVPTESQPAAPIVEEPVKPQKVKKSRAQKKKPEPIIETVVQETPPSAPPKNELQADEADLVYENKLHQINQKYNIEPTSAERWSTLTSDRPVDVFEVQPGNTLELISRTLFGEAQFWPKIWALNHAQISNPHKIYPGQKIYFYPATQTEMPAVDLSTEQHSLGSTDTAIDKMNQEPLVEPAISRGGLSIDGRDYSPQNTYFEKYNIKGRLGKKYAGSAPQPLPDSLPIVRSKTYFVKPSDMQNVFDLKEMVRFDLSPPSNPYVLTPQKLQADFSVPITQLNSLICRENQFVSAVKQNNSDAQPGSYILVDPLTTQNSRLKSTFLYKIIGRVEINEKLQMRIKTCLSLMNTDTMIVSEQKILSLPAPTEEIGEMPTLVESLEAPSQDFFNFGQLVVIGAGSDKTPAGQSFDIYSETVGDVVGQVKVIKNAGTLSIAFLTGITQLIKINDQIKSTNDFSPSKAETTLNQELLPDLNEAAPENKDFEMILE